MISRRVFWRVQGIVTLAILLTAAVQALLGRESVVWTYAGLTVFGQIASAGISDALVFRASARPRQTGVRRRHEDFSDHLVKATAYVLGGLAVTAGSMWLLTYVVWFVTEASWGLRGLWLGLLVLVLGLAWWGLTRDMEI